jgi:ribosomal protein S18 acetylase RimI-like enzyme
VRFRDAGADDADAVARLHADSWRRFYRGAFSDAFLDGDVLAERLTTWSHRLANPYPSATILAEEDGQLVGFAHVIFDDDRQWGSLVDNLHVRHDRRRSGLGRQLLARAAVAATRQATSAGLYLWVLEQNTAAQAFYRAQGGECVGSRPVSPPSGDPANLNGAPRGLRIAWASAAALDPQWTPFGAGG